MENDRISLICMLSGWGVDFECQNRSDYSYYEVEIEGKRYSSNNGCDIIISNYPNRIIFKFDSDGKFDEMKFERLDN